MDIVIGYQPFETTFRGSKVTMQLRPLTRKGFMLISPHFQHFQPDTDKPEIEINKLFELQGVCRELFADHLKDFSGFTVEGKEPTIEQLSEESIFATLCVDIVARLITISSIGNDDSKNSEGQFK